METRNEYNPIVIKYVAVYLRKSRGETLEDLIKHKTILEELCKTRGWVYIIYEEVETGESLFARPVMQQLLRDIGDNTYDAVVCVDLDRLGRGDLVVKDERKAITVRVSSELKFQIDKAANKDNRTINSWIINIIKQHLEECAKKIGQHN